MRLLEVKHIEPRKGGHAILVKFEVVKSTNPERPKGMICGWYQGLTGNSADVGPGVYKRFVTICAGLDPDDPASNSQILESDLEAAVEESQPFAGLLIDAEAIESAKKDENGDPYVNVQWSNAREEAAAS